MTEDELTADDLLTAWRDAIRGAELAERLAAVAADAAHQARARASASAEIAGLAEQAAAAANRAADRARAAATEAAALATALEGQEPPARQIATAARDAQTAAEVAYQRVANGPGPSAGDPGP